MKLEASDQHAQETSRNEAIWTYIQLGPIISNQIGGKKNTMRTVGELTTKDEELSITVVSCSRSTYCQFVSYGCLWI